MATKEVRLMKFLSDKISHGLHRRFRKVEKAWKSVIMYNIDEGGSVAWHFTGSEIYISCIEYLLDAVQMIPEICQLVKNTQKFIIPNSM